MYRCQSCASTVGPRNPAIWITVKKRDKDYRMRDSANKVRISGKKKPLFREDPGGTGWEIQREVKVCNACSEKFNNEELDLSKF